ncbi:MAG: HAD family phosphatase [Roseivivax sp.]|nr:HAD family phosphatase [Roseivivax sp.]
MAIQAVIFDIGNVLIQWQPERYFDRVLGPDRRRAMFDAIDLHAMNDRVDQGQNFAAVMAETIAAYPDWRAELEHWQAHWIDIAAPEMPESVALLRALRARGVPVFALSNFGVETFAMAEPAYPFLTEFDRRYISGHMRMVKPFPEIYAAVEADCGLPPQALLFTDDRADNIQTAADRGWQTHLFDGAAGWHACLRDHGLLP